MHSSAKRCFVRLPIAGEDFCGISPPYPLVQTRSKVLSPRSNQYHACPLRA
jgi:hypothetical protein